MSLCGLKGEFVLNKIIFQLFNDINMNGKKKSENYDYQQITDMVDDMTNKR